MSEGTRTLNQMIQEQTIKSAQAFHSDSISKLENQIQRDRAELESLAEQLPESQQEAKARAQEMANSYAAIASALDQITQELGVEDAVGETVQQAQETGGQVAQEATDGVVDRTRDLTGQVEPAVREVPYAAGQATAQQDEDSTQEPNATEAARQKAEELDVNLGEIIGSGAEGRITVKDVVNAAN